jgi:hypothetical protein
VLLEDLDYVDPSLLFYNDRWWLFVTAYSGRRLLLYYADELSGPWTAHPKNPIVDGNMRLSRSAGRVLAEGDSLFRFAQDGEIYYGQQVWACRINRITTEDYEEQPVSKKPLLTNGAPRRWNSRGMHHVDLQKLDNGRWIASVDGYKLEAQPIR